MSTDLTRSPRTPPTAHPAAAMVALLLGLLLLGFAVVSVRDLAVTQGWASGTPWSTPVVDSSNRLTASSGVVATGVIAALVGAMLVWLAVKPARRTHLRTNTPDADLWLSPGAVARLAQATADRVSGVISADAIRVTHGKVILDVVTSGDRDSVTDRVRAALAEHIQDLTETTISVRTKQVPR